LREGHLTLRLTCLVRAGKASLIIRVEDSGPGFDFGAPLPELPVNTATHGRGLLLVRSLCKEVVFHGKGNAVDAIFEWEPPSLKSGIDSADQA
jgi:anti-sigma regulatory factor (Ser/Thr protein kinase)